MKFRSLKANEIDVRVQSATERGVILLLYKDARCDMNILDETVGPLNWKREHTRDNANCIVSIWDDKKSQWVGKEDTGTESNTEKEKGLASDSFKRACFNWGIGRELYSAPFTWVNGFTYDSGRKDKYGKSIYACNEKFDVSKIEVENNEIIELELIERKSGKNVFSWKKGQAPISQPSSKENPSETPKKDYQESDLDKKFQELWDRMPEEKRVALGEKYPGKFGPQKNPKYFKKSEKEEILKIVEEAKNKKK